MRLTAESPLEPDTAALTPTGCFSRPKSYFHIHILVLHLHFTDRTEIIKYSSRARRLARHGHSPTKRLPRRKFNVQLLMRPHCGCVQAVSFHLNPSYAEMRNMRPAEWTSKMVLMDVAAKVHKSRNRILSDGTFTVTS